MGELVFYIVFSFIILCAHLALLCVYFFLLFYPKSAEDMAVKIKNFITSLCRKHSQK
jgi:hypothetical protein